MTYGRRQASILRTALPSRFFGSVYLGRSTRQSRGGDAKLDEALPLSCRARSILTDSLVPAAAALVNILRPGTLVPSLVGMLSGSLLAVGRLSRTTGLSIDSILSACWWPITLGGVMAVVLTGGSNVLNQITEVDLDRLNKPGRVLPSGRLSLTVARLYCIFLFVLGLALAWFIQPEPGARLTLFCAGSTTIVTVAYSVRPLYLKARGWLANITIATARGALLIVAGWGCVSTATLDQDLWLVAAVFFLFLVGASSTKDFSDAPGDSLVGCKTLVVTYGANGAISRITPFLIFPWLLFPAGVFIKSPAQSGVMLDASPTVMVITGLSLTTYGCWIAVRMRRTKAAVVNGKNDASWKHMYAMFTAGHVGVVVAYLIPP